MTRFKQFPPGPTGVLLPTDSRAAAGLGVCLYTASHPRPLRIQQVAFHIARRLGTRILPGFAHSWHPDIEQWDNFLTTWRRELGAFDSLAIYRRRQRSRTGLTILLTRRDRPVAVTKIRDEADSLRREQQALAAVRDARVTSFRVPEPLGVTTCGNGLTWSAQTAVFDAPHRPVFTAPRDLFEDVREALSPVVMNTLPGHSAAHNDLTPWNLRIDRYGQTWLFDWEDIRSAPHGADRCYFHATSHALIGTAMPSDLPAAALDHWSDIVSARRAESTSDITLRDAILDGLDIARVTGVDNKSLQK